MTRYVWQPVGRVIGCFAIALGLEITAPPVALADIPMGVPVPSNAPRGVPIAIDECSLGYVGNLVYGEIDGVLIKFTNESNVVADVVQIQVKTEGGEGGILRDVGKFSPGIEITHKFREGEGTFSLSPLFSHPHLTCTVVGVHFVNGSTWQPSSETGLAGQTPVPTPPSGPACKPSDVAALGSKAANELDIQDYARALDDSRAAAVLFGSCASSASSADRYLFAAAKAYALAIAGNASLGLDQSKSAVSYLGTARRVLNSIPPVARKSRIVHDEMAKAASSIKQLSLALKNLRLH